MAANNEKGVLLDSVQTSEIRESIVSQVNAYLQSIKLDHRINDDSFLVGNICEKISYSISNAILKNKLGILYDYDTKYMELIKNYEDQLKLVASFQSELRSEITKLFTNSINEASKTLKESGLEERLQTQYLKTYIDSQIECINMSKRFFQDKVLHTVNKIQTEMTESIKDEEEMPIYAKSEVAENAENKG